MKIEHIGIAVKDINEAGKYYKAMFPDVESYEEVLPDIGVKILILQGDNVKIELLEPLGPESTIGKFIERRGEGMHHIAFNVDDIDSSMEKAKEMGIRTLTDKPYKGGDGNIVFFLHPSDTSGVLMEFCQEEK